VPVTVTTTRAPVTSTASYQTTTVRAPASDFANATAASPRIRIPATKTDPSETFDGWFASLIKNVNSWRIIPTNSSNYTNCNETGYMGNESMFCTGGMDDWPEEKFAWMTPNGTGKLYLS
jgi:hypothetical protein